MAGNAADEDGTAEEFDAEAALRGFTPRCPQCGYDLTGVVFEGNCPECGTTFTLGALLAAAEARQSPQERREPPTLRHAPLAAAVILSLVPPLWMPEKSVQVATCAFIALFMAVWLRKVARQIMSGRPLLLLWIIIPIVRVAVPVGFSLGPIVTTLGTVLLVGMVIAWVASRDPRGTFATLAVLLLAPGLILGGAMTLDGLFGVASGAYWSSFEYPFWIDARWRPKQSGMASTVALVIGACILGVWLGLAALAIPVYRRLGRTSEGGRC